MEASGRQAERKTQRVLRDAAVGARRGARRCWAACLGGGDGGAGRKVAAEPELIPQEHAAEHSASMWEAMPRTVVDAAPVTPLGTATAAAAPFSEALAKAAAPRRTPDDEAWAGEEMPAPEFDFGSAHEPVLDAGGEAEVTWSRRWHASDAAKRLVSRYGRPEAPSADGAGAAGGDLVWQAGGQRISKPVAIVPKSVRGYKLPPSSLLYHSESEACHRGAGGRAA